MSTNYRSLKFPLDSARNGAVVTVQGGFICVTDASSVSAYVDIAIDDGAGVIDYIRLRKNGKLEYGKGFEKIYITNPAQAGEYITLTIAASREVFEYTGSDGQNIDSIANPIITRGGNSIPSQGAPVSIGTTATPFFTADSTITEWLAQNLDAAKTIYCGGPGVTTTNYAFTLEPGEKLPGQCTTPPYGVVATGTANLGFMPIKKV